MSITPQNLILMTQAAILGKVWGFAAEKGGFVFGFLKTANPSRVPGYAF